MPNADVTDKGPAMPPDRHPKLSDTWAELRADNALKGRSWSAAAARATDAWLAAAFSRATAVPAGLALVAVGSLGRGDLAPASDLDLLLVHKGRADVVEVADQLWYPIWDDPMPLDHSVRTLAQVQQAAESDLRVGQGVLDARFIAGDTDLGAKLAALGRRLWEKRAGKWLPEVLDAREAAWAAHGDVAFLLEPELQEGRGGLRDLQVLNLLATVTPVLAGLVPDQRLAQAGDLLHSVRVELQRAGARRADRLMLEDQERVAEAVGLAGREEVAYEVAQAGRTVAWVTEDAFRRARSWLSGPRGRRGSADRPLGPGIVLRDNEVVVPLTAAPVEGLELADLVLRAATASAQLGVPMARQTMARMAAQPPCPPTPWTEDLLRSFINLLATGGPGVHAIETLDQLGIWEKFVPEWPRVRNCPQFNPYHRWSVDRHLLETAAGAAAYLRDVHRPDLLLLGALFHDIGKGSGGDHSQVGAAMVAKTAVRYGLSAEDGLILENVVRHHLLLPEVATRRDLDDPATARSVADAVGDETTLEVLTALAAADGQATGPSAWSPWKAGLVNDLARRAHALLAGRPVPEGEPFPSDGQRQLFLAGGFQAHPFGRHLVVIAPDRPGLFSAIAGVLGLHGIGVLEARVHSEGGAALEAFTLDLVPEVSPRWERVTADLEAAASGELNVSDALARRPPERRRARTAVVLDPTTRVIVDNEGATAATIVEVRAPDAPGILHKITALLADEGLDIVSARVATLGGAVVDTFYVRDASGGPVPNGELGELRSRLEASLGSAPPEP